MKNYLKLIAAYTIYLAIFFGIILAVFLFREIPSNGYLPPVTQPVGEPPAKPVEQSKPRVDKLDAKAKYVILTFDDGWDSQYEAFQQLKPWKGTLYISSGLIGQAERLTVKELKEMYRNGWDISNHTVHHTNLTKVSASKAAAEVYGCTAWILGHGFTRNQAYLHFAYPEGAYDNNIIELLQQQNILSARTTNPGNVTTDLMQLGRTSLHGMTKKNIRDNLLSDQKLLILSFHRVVPDDSPVIKEIDIRQSDFQEVIKAIRESNRKVITMTDWYNSQF